MRLRRLVVSNPRQQREAYEQIAQQSQPKVSFYVMTSVSTTIAAYGLLANSTAVVIGAMLVAPLMGPIFGIALGLAAGDRRLLAHALLGEVSGVIAVILLAAMIGLMPLRMEFGTEIAARTQPTLYDVVVALASGLAGAYALADPRMSPALPGVAIATALVPPLATCGLCLAAMEWAWAGGAFMLFVANFLAIELAAAVVFSMYGTAAARPRTQPVSTAAEFLKRFGVTIAALVLVAWFMTHTLSTVVADRRLTADVRSTLTRELHQTVGAELTGLRLETTDLGTKRVIARVVTPMEFGPENVAQLESALRLSVDSSLELVVRSLLSKDSGRDGPVFIEPEMLEQLASRRAETEFLNTASRTLSEEIASLTGARLADVRREARANEDVITAVVHAPAFIEPDAVGRMQEALRARLGPGTRLVVRSITARDADATGFVYATGDPASITAERTSKALRRAFVDIPGARLVDVQGAVLDDRLTITAVVQTPRPIAPERVAQIEEQIQAPGEPPVRLIVRSVITRDSDSARFIDWDVAETAEVTPEERAFARRLEQAVRNQLALRVPDATLSELHYEWLNGVCRVEAVTRTPRAIEPWQVRVIEGQLTKHVDPAIVLVVRSELGAAASSSGYIKADDEPL